MKKINSHAFTLVEIMIVVAVIGVIAAIAIPNFMQSRIKALESVCLASGLQLSNSLEIAALTDNVEVAGLTEGEIESILVPDYIRSMPDCPNGDYSSDSSGMVHCSDHNP